MASSTAPSGSTRSRLPWFAAFLVGILVAAFQGAHLPSRWAMTLYAMSIEDGTVRRTLLGTVLQPLWWATGHHYAVAATVAFILLAALLAVVVVAGLRARWTAQRVLVLAFLLAPTGGYLFHEVGLLDQAVYLLLFLSLFLWTRVSSWVAVLPVVAATFVHELTLLTAWPVLVWWAWIRGTEHASAAEEPTPRTPSLRWLPLALPPVAGLLVALTPLLEPAQAEAAYVRLAGLWDFPVRADTVALYAASLTDLWPEFDPVRALARLLMFAVVVAAVWAWLRLARPNGVPLSTIGASFAVVVSVAPVGLGILGWDLSRWVFLLLCNATLVAFLWMGRQKVPISWWLGLVFTAPLLLLVIRPLVYFDALSPRPWTVDALLGLVSDPQWTSVPPW